MLLYVCIYMNNFTLVVTRIYHYVTTSFSLRMKVIQVWNDTEVFVVILPLISSIFLSSLGSLLSLNSVPGFIDSWTSCCRWSSWETSIWLSLLCSVHAKTTVCIVRLKIHLIWARRVKGHECAVVWLAAHHTPPSVGVKPSLQEWVLSAKSSRTILTGLYLEQNQTVYFRHVWTNVTSHSDTLLRTALVLLYAVCTHNGVHVHTFTQNVN